jgi:hypothetical protein
MREHSVRAKDAQVVHSYQAVCYRPGCTWTGPQRRTYRDANDDRQQHLAGHADAMQEDGTP